MIIHYPVCDSKFVSLETSSSDHYNEIPLSTPKVDFKKPVTVLYYSEHTQGYNGEPVEGVDKIVKLTSDFVMALLRIMPHASEPERLKSNLAAMQYVTVKTLSQHLGMPEKPALKVDFQAFDQNEDIYENNYLEVMQLVFNHTIFDPNDKMDQEVLAVMKPLGVEPGKIFDPLKVSQIGGKKFREVAEKVAKESIETWNSPEGNPCFYDAFKPKGQMTFAAMVAQSVIGSIGNPAAEAMYPNVNSDDGQPMNSQYDYVLRMIKEQMPPVKAFWSAALYDTKYVYFIPNDHKKYIVGENGEMKHDGNVGIAIYIAAEQPEGVPEENWLPINRKDERIF